MGLANPLKGQKIREIYTPVPKESPALGLSLQWMPLTSTGDVWHVLDVSPNSPADLAGILPYGDYIIGSPEGVVKGESGLAELVEDVITGSVFIFMLISQYLERPLQLFVYNHEYNITRLVDMTPSRQWGGQGALGCTLGYGALHRIPPTLDEPPDAPGDTIFDTAATEEKQGASVTHSDAAGFVVPAEQFSKATPSAAPLKEERRARHPTHISPSAEMDDYFREEEQRSREQDAPKPKTGLPPPPKAAAKPGHSKG